MLKEGRIIKTLKFKKMGDRITSKDASISLWTDDDGLFYVNEQPIGHISIEDGEDLALAVLTSVYGGYYMVQMVLPI